jgi:hypothetical protein|tara:strand:+ start:356 stop:541 length:186 start_codon:yes stop_codon:yes gene_type:complete
MTNTASDDENEDWSPLKKLFDNDLTKDLTDKEKEFVKETMTNSELVRLLQSFKNGQDYLRN